VRQRAETNVEEIAAAAREIADPDLRQAFVSAAARYLARERS
jgi:hypothetical protein